VCVYDRNKEGTRKKRHLMMGGERGVGVCVCVWGGGVGASMRGDAGIVCRSGEN
jgi:hypothetical protein